MHVYEKVIRTYMKALGESDYDTIKGLFSEDGEVQSPFIGLNNASSFFDQLGGASSNNDITPIDVFLSQDDKEHAVAYFQYDWTVKDGTLISFKVMDLFTFEPGSDKIRKLDLIYDTHPIRETAGNKYES